MNKKALIIVDVQNDFCDGGALAVTGGGQIVPKINKIMDKFDYVLTTQDCHPEDHVSFGQWPVHCVQKTPGAQLHPLLDFSRINNNFKKGLDKNFDSYSGFFDDNGTSTGLNEYLQERSVKELYVCGLALDYCVKATVLDAVKLGYVVSTFSDLTRAVDPTQFEKTFHHLANNGCNVYYSFHWSLDK